MPLSIFLSIISNMLVVLFSYYNFYYLEKNKKNHKLNKKRIVDNKNYSFENISCFHAEDYFEKKLFLDLNIFKTSSKKTKQEISIFKIEKVKWLFYNKVRIINTVPLGRKKITISYRKFETIIKNNKENIFVLS